jgi:hypothetical protein
MANRTSTAIANMTATPKVLNNPARGVGELKEVVGVVTSAADDASGSVFRFNRIPSNARVSQVLLCAADATTAGAINIGLYDTAENGGAAVDADLFASAVDLTGGPFNNLDVTFESGEYTYAESEKPLWEVLGLSADPCKDYDLVAVVSTTFDGGPTSIRLAARFVK